MRLIFFRRYLDADSLLICEEGNEKNCLHASGEKDMLEAVRKYGDWDVVRVSPSGSQGLRVMVRRSRER
jgi:hypothetical protein